MSQEIERKFVIDKFAVVSAASRENIDVKIIRQGYLSDEKSELSTRVRLIGTTKAVVTIKTKESGISRSEWEYPIPVMEANEILDNINNIVEKTRFTFKYENFVLEVDSFEGKNKSLMLMEVELDSLGQSEEFDEILPDFIIKEVTDDSRYRNEYLAYHPFCDW